MFWQYIYFVGASFCLLFLLRHQLPFSRFIVTRFIVPVVHPGDRHAHPNHEIG